jgi:cellulose biosynthesis protein BcsQ
MITIAFYSYKGGVGRSLAVANVAHYLALLGQKVVVVDFDLEAPGIHYKLVPPEVLESEPIKGGVVDLIYEIAVEGVAKTEPASFLRDVPVPAGSEGSIKLLPAGAAPLREYWSKLSRIDLTNFVYAPEGKGLAFFLSLKESIQEQTGADFLLIDSRTGVTEIGGVATTVLADVVLCLFLNNPENLEGTKAMIEAFRDSPRPPGADQLTIIPVLSRLPGQDNDEENIIVGEVEESLRDAGGAAINLGAVSVLHFDHDLHLKERLLVGDSGAWEVKLLRDYVTLFARVVPQDIIDRRINALVDHARVSVLDDPDLAQKNLEYFGFAFDSKRALDGLIRLYKLRGVGGIKILKAAERFWKISDNHFYNEMPWGLLHNVIQSLISDGTNHLPADFLEEVWRRSGRRGGMLMDYLISVYSRQGRNDKAEQIVNEHDFDCSYKVVD